MGGIFRGKEIKTSTLILRSVYKFRHIRQCEFARLNANVNKQLVCIPHQEFSDGEVRLKHEVE